MTLIYQTLINYNKSNKRMAERIKQIEDKKSDKIMYRLPAQICNYSLF